MGLVYYNGRFIPEEHIQKAADSDRVLRLLRSFLDKNEPGLVRILVNTWNSQGKAITYKELREAILAGDIDPEWLEDWMQDYARFVRLHLQPAWELAIATAATEIERRFQPEWHFDLMGDGIRLWTESRAAEFITNVTNTQLEGIRAVVRRAAVLDDLTVDELARAIRPMVGLTAPQASANLKYYETLRENGMSEKRAQDRAIRYAARQHRQRGYMIARTELATAYNSGAFEGAKQAQAAGLLGECVKEWSTAADERVCPVCGSLQGKQIPMDAEFPGASRTWSTKLHPPAHVGCRCGLKIVEIAPPKFENSVGQLKIQNTDV